MNDYYLGGDVSKGYCDFTMLSQNRGIVEKNFQLDDTAQGHEVLSQKLISFLQENPKSTLHVAFESTGGYENNWLHSLSKLSADYKIRVARLNALGVNHHHKASLKRNTTDPISAGNIAEYLIAYPTKVTYNQQSSFTEERSLYGHIELLTKQNTQLLNRLESELYKGNPSLLCYWKDSLSQWLLSVIEKWPTAANLSKATVKQIAAIPYVSGKRAVELKTNAGKSVASAVSVATGITIESLATQIIQKTKAIDKLKGALIDMFQIPEVKILTSLPGIAEYTAIGLIIEIDGIERFKNAGKLCAYFGIHPVFKQSGDGTWGFFLSKKGRRRPRRLLYMSAMNAVQNDLMLKEFYDDLLKKGREGRDALCIVMHKMLRIIYGMLKSKRKYDPMINKRDKDRNLKNQDQEKNDIKEMRQARRMQEPDKMAPISRRQTKKRKKQKDIQNAAQISKGVKSTLKKE